MPAPEPAATTAPAVVDRADLISKSLAHPFRRAESDFATLSGDDEIRAQVSEVLGTALGSIPWRTDFGSNLHRLRNQGNTPILRETERVFVDDAIRKWVPGVQLVSVNVTSPKPNVVDMTVVFQLGNKQQSLTQRL